MYNVYHIAVTLCVFTYVSGMYDYHSWYDIYSNKHVQVYTLNIHSVQYQETCMWVSDYIHYAVL